MRTFKNISRAIFAVAMLSIVHCGYGAAGGEVTFDPTVQRYVGNTTSLDRVKFFKLHSGYTTTDTDITKMLNEYDVTLGRGFWGPMAWIYNSQKDINKYLTHPNQNTIVRPVNGIITSERPGNTVVHMSMDLEKVGEWMAEYFNNYSGAVIPEYYEPISEPFVSAAEGYQEYGASSLNELLEFMADFFAASGRYIHSKPQLANMKVIGYGAAYPTYERNDFQQWDERMKMFIDRAGEHMDGISIHLYDGLNAEAGQHTRRAGSNGEAIMDLIETYTKMKLGVVKPFAMSEYGGIFNHTGDNKIYVEEEQSQLVGSVNHQIFSYIEREDNMLISIPFITGKNKERFSEAYDYNPYCATLFLPRNPYDMAYTTWYYSSKIHFYDFWKGVNGVRVDIESSNPDIQTLAFRDGDRLYLALDNLDDYPQTIAITNEASGAEYSSITKRSLESTTDLRGIIYSESTLPNMPNELTLQPNEAVLLIADIVGSPESQIKSVLRRTKYYENDYLHQISASKAITSTFTGVMAGAGRAKLRMSINRTLEASKRPTIKVNGHAVTVPTNWAGYDQSDRATQGGFFGMIEVPFPIEYLVEGTNSVSTTFPDGGGRLSTMILEVELYDNGNVFIPSELQDGDFEQGNLTNWIPLTLGGTVELTNASGEVKLGRFAAKISGAAALSQKIDLADETAYSLSFESRGAAVKVMVNGVEIGTTAATSGYEQSSFDFATEANGEVVITFEVSGGEACIDECNIAAKRS